MGRWPGSDHDGWEGFMEMERMQLSERAHGKLRRAIGRTLPGESREQLEQHSLRRPTHGTGRLREAEER